MPLRVWPPPEGEVVVREEGTIPLRPEDRIRLGGMMLPTVSSSQPSDSRTSLTSTPSPLTGTYSCHEGDDCCMDAVAHHADSPLVVAAKLVSARSMTDLGSGVCQLGATYLPNTGLVWCGVVWCGVVWCGVVWCLGVVLRRVGGFRFLVERRFSGWARVLVPLKAGHFLLDAVCGAMCVGASSLLGVQGSRTQPVFGSR